MDGVDLERTARQQLLDLSHLHANIIRHPVAVMPDVHSGIGCTVGTVIPTVGALIPASVGVDIGCGMIAVQTSLTASMLPDSLEELRLAVESRVPHGRTHGGRSSSDAGGWRGKLPDRVASVWKTELAPGFEELCAREPGIASSNHVNHLGTLGTGNHFIEVCLDDDLTEPHVWIMLHSGSRGVGNRIGSIYIEKAQRDMGNVVHALPSTDLAYLTEGTQHFKEYVAAVEWAQSYALWNRRLMLELVLDAMREVITVPFTTDAHAINCHHNYVERYEVQAALHPDHDGEDDEDVMGETVWLTRKGATAAYAGQLAVIPGSMGVKSYVVRGKGNPHSYCSCSHGAGRRFSRGEAKRRFTVEEHEAATAGVACRKDAGVLDETPAAYKDIDAVMRAQTELVEVVRVLRQVLCVKG